MRYAMLIWGDETSWANGGDTAQAVMRDIYAWWDKWHAAGKVAPGGVQLDPVRTARTVSRGGDGQPLVTDGPYLELKEVIGGTIILQVDDIDEAVAIAATWPGIASFDEKVEVRPVVEN